MNSFRYGSSRNDLCAAAGDLFELRTPCLVLELDRVKRNASRMISRVQSLGTQLRPHVKSHKCIEVARLQTAGASGAIAVSTLMEASVFAEHGFTDVMYAVPIEPGKFEEAILVSKKCDPLHLITDDISIPPLLNDAARRAGVTIHLFLKVDCGYGRCGVQPHAPASLRLAHNIASLSNLRFAGVMTHAGHSYSARSRDELLAIARQERDVVTEFAAKLRASGLEVPLTSIGSTPTIGAVDHLEGIDEVRPGNYIFFDTFQATLGSCGFEDCAVTVLAAVVSRDETRRQVVIDAGAIALSKDPGPVQFDAGCGYGRVLDIRGNDLGLRVTCLSQEHGVIQADKCQAIAGLKVGSRVRILINHACLATAQHGSYQVLENGRIVGDWKPFRGWYSPESFRVGAHAK